MAKFTKLNIGDAVASSGGRVWKKLSSMLQISFTIGSTEYQAEQGMTWGEWVDSQYNTGVYIVRGNVIKTSDGLFVKLNGNTVASSDTIVDNASYQSEGSGGSND